MDTTRSNRMLMGKYGLSNGVDCCAFNATTVRYLILGENSLITSAHTRSFSRNENSGF